MQCMFREEVAIVGRHGWIRHTTGSCFVVCKHGEHLAYHAGFLEEWSWDWDPLVVIAIDQFDDLRG